jgi:predicted enzyme related to lactoylglutathione lyase
MTEYEITEGSIAHIELITDDIDVSRRFYEEVFGWEITVDEEMNYTMWQAPNAPSGAFFDASEWPTPTPSTLFYVNVSDLDATSNAITDAGGEIVMEETVVPKMGKFVVFRDPGGITEAVWEDTY